MGEKAKPETAENKVLQLISELGGEVVSKFDGVIVDLCYEGNLDQVLVKLISDRESFHRIFPRVRLQACEATCVGAEFEYTIYRLGAFRASMVVNVTPSMEDLLERDWITISEEDLAELDRP